MANTRPIKPSTDPNLVIEVFQIGDAVDPNYGGTGLNNADLAGNVGKVLAVNATADGYTLTAGGGGGGNGIYGGSGIVPAGTRAELTAGAIFRIDYSTEYNGAAAAITIDDANGGILLTDPTGSAQFGTDGGSVSMATSNGSFVISTTDAKFLSFSGLGIEYYGDYSATIAANDRSIPDVGTVKQIAIPIDATGLGIEAYAGDLVWRTSPGEDFECGLLWNQIINTNPVSPTFGDNVVYSGSFCWYGGTEATGNRSYFLSNGEETYFEFGGLEISSGNKASLKTTTTEVRMQCWFGGVNAFEVVLDQNFTLNSTTGTLILPRLNTTQRDALSPAPAAGSMIFNTTAGKTQTYDGATWQNHW